MNLSLKALIALTLLFVLPLLLLKQSAFLGQYSLSIESFNGQVNVTAANVYFPPVVYPGALVEITLHNNENYPVVVYLVKVNGQDAQTIPVLPAQIPPKGNLTVYVEIPITSSSINLVVYV